MDAPPFRVRCQLPVPLGYIAGPSSCGSDEIARNLLAPVFGKNTFVTLERIQKIPAIIFDDIHFRPVEQMVITALRASGRRAAI